MTNFVHGQVMSVAKKETTDGQPYVLVTIDEGNATRPLFVFGNTVERIAHIQQGHYVLACVYENRAGCTVCTSMKRFGFVSLLSEISEISKETTEAVNNAIELVKADGHLPQGYMFEPSKDSVENTLSLLLGVKTEAATSVRVALQSVYTPERLAYIGRVYNPKRSGPYNNLSAAIKLPKSSPEDDDQWATVTFYRATADAAEECITNRDNCVLFLHNKKEVGGRCYFAVGQFSVCE